MTDSCPIASYKHGLFTITGYNNAEGYIRIPDSIDGHPVEAIGTGAFMNAAELTDVILPESIRRIDDSAFQGCSALRTIRMPSYMDYIGAFAFADCDSLQQITLPDGLELIPYCCFSTCTDLLEVRLPNTLLTIANKAFEECRSLTGIVFPDKLQGIGNGAFYNCLSIAAPVFPAGISSIGQAAFYRSSLNGPAFHSITLPASLTLLGSKAFRCMQLIIEGNPDIDALCNDVHMIIAPSVDPEDFIELRSFSAACVGLAYMIENNDTVSPRIIDRYFSLIKNDPNRVYPVAIENIELMRLLIRNRLIPKEDIQILIELCTDHTEFLIELLDYSRQFDPIKVDTLSLDVFSVE